MNGRFQPGTSGNPGGRPRAAHSIQELAREHTIDALDVLVQIMLNEKAPPNARVAAANTLLDRAYGKAPTFSTTDPGTFKRAIDMTDDVHCLLCHLSHARIVATTKAPIVMAMKMSSATGPNILNTPKQISPQAKTKSIELSSRSA